MAGLDVGADSDAFDMSPDPRSRSKPKRSRDRDEVPSRPSPDDAHEIVYFQRHREDDPDRSVPGQIFLSGCPTTVRAKIVAVLTAVAADRRRDSPAAATGKRCTEI